MQIGIQMEYDSRIILFHCTRRGRKILRTQIKLIKTGMVMMMKVSMYLIISYAIYTYRVAIATLMFRQCCVAFMHYILHLLTRDVFNSNL